MRNRVKKTHRLHIVFILLLYAGWVSGQPFVEEINRFKELDSIRLPEKKAVLFVGSSTFRLWPDIASDFPDIKIINRGFGGSQLSDVMRYAGEIIYPYNPKQIVIYCGENDIASGLTAEQVTERLTTLVSSVRDNLPQSSIVFVSMKPSPSRMAFYAELKRANEFIKNYLKSKENTSYVDVFTLMLNDQGKPREELFVEDMLHMNAEGYRIWQKALYPYLKK